MNGGGYNNAHIDFLEPFEYDFFENDTISRDPTIVGNRFQMVNPIKNESYADAVSR